MAAMKFAVVLACSSSLLPFAIAKSRGCGAGGTSCAAGEGAQMGAAMLQQVSDKDVTTKANSKDAPLEGRAATLAAEIESLTNRVSILMTTVGLAEGTALLDKTKKPYEKYASLLRTKYDDAALKEVVTDLEAKSAALKGNIKQLENMVFGTQFDTAVLLAAKIHRHSVSEDSLSNRIMALEEVVGSMRNRVAELEERVSLGLHQEGAKSASMLQEDSQDAPFNGRLDTLESEVASLKQRTAAVETETMGSSDISAVSMKTRSRLALLASSSTESQETSDKTEEVKNRVAALEADTAALTSKLSMLENQVMGGGDVSLLATDTLNSGSSLKARIVALEETVDVQRTRVSNLEHTVVG